MKMAEVIIALLLLGGGFLGGSTYQKNKCDQELQEVLEQSSVKIDSVKSSLALANLKLDSLQSLPAKIDTVVKFQTKIVERTDTLIIISNEILMNTDTIKNELRQHIRKIDIVE